MPLYTYRCNSCGNMQDILASWKDREIIALENPCEVCGGTDWRYVPGVPADPKGGDTPKFGKGGGKE